MNRVQIALLYVHAVLVRADWGRFFVDTFSHENRCGIIGIEVWNFFQF
jgi:hypothetical protein